MESKAVRVGIDIAKNVFAIFAVDEKGTAVIRKMVSRRTVLTLFSNMPPCVIGIEACSGSQYWARELNKLGHEVRLISMKFVIPYRKNGKNDLNDAEAICEAVGRPGMRFVAVKTEDQQAILMAHRIRSQSIARRTALINQIHGHALEFGFVIRKGRRGLGEDLHSILDSDQLPSIVEELLHNLYHNLLREEENIAYFDKLIEGWVKQDEIASRLMSMEGVGPITASAVAATVGDPKVFKNGRQMASWLGLVPRQYSSGGKNKLGRITKTGDKYVRMLLIHGARSVLIKAKKGVGRYHNWIQSLRTRRPDNVVAVAFAAKQARMIWAVMMGKQELAG